MNHLIARLSGPFIRGTTRIHREYHKHVVRVPAHHTCIQRTAVSGALVLTTVHGI